MKRILPAVGIALAFAVVATAQTQYPTDQTAKPKSSMGSKTVTLAGCVREGDTPNTFVLANVDLSKMTDMSTRGRETNPPTAQTDPTATPPPTTPPTQTQTHPPTSSTGTSGMASDSAATVALVGGAELKQHVGHQVEVTGVMVPQGKDKKNKTTGTTGSATGETTTDTTSRPGEHGMGKGKNVHTLNVQTVKMVSATCTMQ